jgi:hypothetical protein
MTAFIGRREFITLSGTTVLAWPMVVAQAHDEQAINSMLCKRSRWGAVRVLTGRNA